MTSPVDIANLALAEGATRSAINGFPPIDNSPAAVASKLFYTPKTQALLRGANWDFCRRQANLSLLRRAINADGTASSDPPSQPWQYEYLYPSDCLRARFLIQFQSTTASGLTIPLTSASGATIYPAYAVTRVPFVIAADINASGQPRKTILTNMQDAMLIYTADLSQSPDMWDAMFLTAETAYLAAYLIANLSADKQLMAQQIGIAKMAIDGARSVNGNEGISNVDHIPDWLRARWQGGVPYGAGYNRGTPCDWD